MRAFSPRPITSDRSFYYALPAAIDGKYSPSLPSCGTQPQRTLRDRRPCPIAGTDTARDPCRTAMWCLRMAVYNWPVVAARLTELQNDSSFCVGPPLAAGWHWSRPLATLLLLDFSSTRRGLREEGRICSLQMLQSLVCMGPCLVQDAQIPRVSLT
jgi:hypothetical protein